MISFPNAKINIGLHITNKRPDGFHSIESFFYPIQWQDILEIIPSEKLSFHSTGIPVPDDKKGNLCIQAYHILAKNYNLPPVRIHLHKVIPIGAGLGGGSADASFTLLALNNLFKLGLNNEKVQEYARKLGSDCAFFIENMPKFCFGKGDQFKNIPNSSLYGKFIGLVYPDIHISTQDAYKNIQPNNRRESLSEILINIPIQEWKNHIKNDFEMSLFPKYPSLQNIKNKLYDLGAVYSSMTGSGSSIYGVFDNDINLQKIFPKEYQIWKGQLY